MGLLLSPTPRYFDILTKFGATGEVNDGNLKMGGDRNVQWEISNPELSSRNFH